MRNPLMDAASANFSGRLWSADRKHGIKTLADFLERLHLAFVAAERGRIRDVMADLGQEASPILQPIAKSFAVDGDHQRTVRDPGANQFDGLLRFRNAIRDVEFEGPFGVLEIAHVNGAFNTRYKLVSPDLIGAGCDRKNIANAAAFDALGTRFWP